jgi:GTP cyclohydrolase 1|nr:MAG TPA: GTP cyclohydrolase I [Caudoviricetes sp.]
MALDKSKCNPELGKKIHDHLVSLGCETPMAPTSPSTYKVRQARLETSFTKIMENMHLDLTDDSLQDTPKRVAKMYLYETCWGLDYDNFPKITAVENKAKYHDLLVERVSIQSLCMAASTHVNTASGSVPISQLKDGDWVYTLDESTNKVKLAQVTNPHCTRENAELVELLTDNGPIFCTPEHRFRTLNRGWVAAEDLNAGDAFATMAKFFGDTYPSLLPADDPHVCRVVDVKPAEHREDVWNMEVEGTHNYFVSGICAHNCEHHWVYFGTSHNPSELGCWIAYIPKDKVLGLSKLNRVAEFFSRRPQIQERLTKQIAESLKFILETDDVAVVMKAQHFCVLTRGVEDANSYTISSHLSGEFEKPEVRAELMAIVNR